VGGSLWERVVSDVGSQVKEILGFHLGIDGSHLADDTRFEDLGADSLDVVEIVMSCEERFGVEIPNREATSLVTVGDAVRCVEAQLAALAAAPPLSRGHRLRVVLSAK
jgi:acyl carrier protein